MENFVVVETPSMLWSTQTSSLLNPSSMGCDNPIPLVSKTASSKNAGGPVVPNISVPSSTIPLPFASLNKSHHPPSLLQLNDACHSKINSTIYTSDIKNAVLINIYNDRVRHITGTTSKIFTAARANSSAMPCSIALEKSVCACAYNSSSSPLVGTKSWHSGFVVTACEILLRSHRKLGPKDAFASHTSIGSDITG